MMTQFWLFAGVLTLLALAFLLLPILLARKPAEAEASPSPSAAVSEKSQTGVSVYRAHLAELQSDLAEGNISQEQFDKAHLDLQRNLLEMSGSPQESPRTTKASWRWPTAVASLLLLPVAAYFIYEDQGAGMAGMVPASAPAMAGQTGGISMPDLDAAIKALSARLENNPHDTEGWIMLGRSFLFLGEIRSAAGAFAQAIRYGAGDDPETLLTYADLIGSLDNGNLSLRARPFIERAVALAPESATALWMAGMAAFQNAEYPEAETYWSQLNGRFAPGSEEDVLIQRSLQELNLRLSATEAESRARLSGDSGSVISGDDIGSDTPDVDADSGNTTDQRFPEASVQE